jgi:hypothetical protein
MYGIRIVRVIIGGQYKSNYERIIQEMTRVRSESFFN